jgi:hypothetical protein
MAQLCVADELNVWVEVSNYFLVVCSFIPLTTAKGAYC